MADLSVKFAGLELKNPLIAAAGPITATVEHVARMAGCGIAAVVTKTGFTRKEYQRWVGRKDIFPYKPVYKYQSLINGRLLSLPTLSDLPVSDMARRVERMKKRGITVIGSVMGLTPGGYVESARILADAGADAIELDLCCTIPEFTTAFPYAGQNANFHPALYARLVDGVKSAVAVPVGVKSTMSLYMYGRIFEGLIRAKLKNSPPDFITAVGQLDENPGVDLDTLRPLIPHIPTFGWQGSLSGLTYSAIATLSSTLGTVNPYLSASGGIRDHEGVLNALALGATTVQLQTVILDKGPAVIRTILERLEGYLDAHHLAGIGEIIGAASRDYIPSMSLGRFMLERDTLSGLVKAVVDGERCTNCGVCEGVCTENAVRMVDGKAEIDKGACRGCNLCVLKCPRSAIALDNLHLLKDLIERHKRSAGVDSFRGFMAQGRIGLFDKLLIRGRLKKWGIA